MTVNRRAALAALALACLPAAAPAQETGAFLVRMGTDTLAVERYTRSADRLEGEIVVRSPRTGMRRYTALLRPDGTISAIDIRVLSADGSAEMQRIAMDLGADSARWSVFMRDTLRQQGALATPTPGVPIVGNSYAIYEQALRYARAKGGEQVVMSLVPPGGNRTYDMTVRFTGADAAEVTNIAGLSRASLDASGGLRSWDGGESTVKVLVDRVAGADVRALAAAYAARDAAGQSVGQLSPRDTAEARLGAATVSVDYGRPAKRGRTILGQVVPWGRVWRTGANAATQLRTDRDLVIGGTPVPAGTYTLWTVPERQGWTLIVNRQTGQWGTEYDESKDLARIPMRREDTAAPVEQFTIELVPGGEGGVLRMEWDDTRVSVPIVAR
jgi:hypothetical protein